MSLDWFVRACAGGGGVEANLKARAPAWAVSVNSEILEDASLIFNFVTLLDHL